MARDGSGNHTLTDGTYSGNNVCAQQKANSVKIVASRMDTILADISTALTASIAKDGQTPITADLPMGGYKHTNVASSSAQTDYARTDQVQRGSFIWGGTSGGSANAQTITLSPAPSALVAGMTVRFIAGYSNTGAVTLNTNSLGAVAIRSRHNSAVALKVGAIRSGAIIEVLYDGTFWRLVSSSAEDTTWSPSYTPNSGAISPTTLEAVYQVIDGWVHFQLTFSFTISSGTPSAISVTAPVAATDPHVSALFPAKVGTEIGVWRVTSGQITISRLTGNLTSGWIVSVDGKYKIA